jgi:hypothetical protein
MAMEKNLLIIFLAVSSFTADAQGETKIGIKAGFTSANVYGSDVAQLSSNGNPTSLQGFHVGLFVNSKISKHFWLKSEVISIQKGTVLSIKDKWSQLYSSNLKSQYIDIYPASPTFHFKGFQLLAGPYVSMLLTSSIQQKDSLGVMSTNNSIFGIPSQNSKYRQKLDAGFVLGIEYETKWGISIGGRYTKGFIPLIENAAAITPVNAPEQPQQKIFNESYSLSIGYSLGKKESAKAKK